MKQNIVKEKSFNFAVEIISLYKELQNNKEYVLSKQLLRSGTSIGANIQEATAAVSRKDFINKMAIASKEARETKYWLELYEKSQLVNQNFDLYINECDELIRLLTAIIKTTQHKDN